jgi:acyl-CoA reductase-like NAD-dependent aldehyde dehydrogenase
MTLFNMLIDGKLVSTEDRLEVINPATGAAFADCSVANQSLLDQAVQAAKKAQKPWAKLNWAKRGGPLATLASRVEARLEDFARLLVQEQGKPIADARGETQLVVDFLRYYATATLSVEKVSDNTTTSVEVHHKPLGVVAAICPWNFPLLIAAYKMAPAVLTGNSVIIKPAATTPLTTLLLGELAADLFPAGVVNVIVDRNDLGAALSQHPDVAKVTFTGSTATGKKVMEAASSTLKRITLELGGNDAAIILDDADINQVSEKIFDAAFNLSGQVCTAVKRVYVPSKSYDAVCNRLAEIANTVKIGSGLDEDTKIGPVQNQMQVDKIKGFLDVAKRDGKVIAGGDLVDAQGYFIQPTVVRDIDPKSQLVEDEQFGPVLPVLAYDDLDEVISTVNDSDYGLGSSVWGADTTKASEVALMLEAGSIWVNRHGYIAPEAPFAGAKQSGIGIEMGVDGLKEFTQMQLLVVEKG